MLLLLLLTLSFRSSNTFQCPNTSLSIQPHCPYFNNRPIELVTPSLTSSSNCYWYRTQSCCTFHEAELVVGETVNNLFTDASVGCLDLLNLLVCYVCSPNQSEFYQPGQLVICRLVLVPSTGVIWYGPVYIYITKLQLLSVCLYVDKVS